MVFGVLRVREGADISSLLRDLTSDHCHIGQLLCHYANDLDKLIPFQLICNNVLIVAALSGIVPKRWGVKRDGLYLSQ